MSVLLDTHAAIWLLEGNDRLSSTARAAIEAETDAPPAIAAITLLEIALLAQLGRICFEDPLEKALVAFERHLAVVPLTAAIAADAVALELPHRDPFDRIVMATARIRGFTLITKDRRLRDSGLVRTVW